MSNRPAEPGVLQSDEIGARAARHLDLVFRSLADGPGVERNAQFMRLLTGEPHPMGNLAIVAVPDSPAVTSAAVRPLVERNLPAAVIFFNGVSAPVATALADQGFQPESMPAMAVAIERLTPTQLPPGYAFERIAATASKGWTEALADGYEIPPNLARIFSPEALQADPTPGATIQWFAIVKDGRAVATTLLYLADGLAGIYCVATLPAERGKGLGAHVTAEALRAAHALGSRVGILQSSAAGHSIYLRLGFEDKLSVPMFVRMPA
jgi:GNAT superfamily N-acetyltransferase